jgi:NAD-dependent SIR2 family protein deacetylase
MSTTLDVVKAADILIRAEAIIVSAGAGMGVDSGLPDFRGKQGFWKAYPPLQKLNIDFVNAANPKLFVNDPNLAWAFYGHRLNLYRSTNPHKGYSIIRKWTQSSKLGHFVYTSNVDGAFQKAGFSHDRIVECHGSINHAQCTMSPHCNTNIRPAPPYEIDIDMDAFKARRVPKCAACGETLRPNILMFGDWGFDDSRTLTQRAKLDQWYQTLRPTTKIALIECGAGTDIPSIRAFNSSVQSKFPSARLIRINPRECEVYDERDVGLPLGALDALTQIDSLI